MRHTRRFTEETEVPIARSRMALEALLRAHGATGFMFGWNDQQDRIEFALSGRHIRFVLPRIEPARVRETPRGRQRTPAVIEAKQQQADRQRWRALYLVVRAKIEAVDAGIAEFDQEFLAFLVQRDGRTVGEVLLPQLGPGMPERLRLGP